MRSRPSDPLRRPRNSRPRRRRSPPSARSVLASLDPMPTASASSAIAEVRGELRSRSLASERVECELRRGRTRPDQLRARCRRASTSCAISTGTTARPAELLESPLIEEMERAEQRTIDARAALDAGGRAPPAGRRGRAERARRGSRHCKWRSTWPAPGPAPITSPISRGCGTGCSARCSISSASTTAGNRPSRRRSGRRSPRSLCRSRRPRRRARALRQSDTNGAVLSALGSTPDRLPGGSHRRASSPARQADRADVDRLLDVLLPRPPASAALPRPSTRQSATRPRSSSPRPVTGSEHPGGGSARPRRGCHEGRDRRRGAAEGRGRRCGLRRDRRGRALTRRCRRPSA